MADATTATPPAAAEAPSPPAAPAPAPASEEDSKPTPTSTAAAAAAAVEAPPAHFQPKEEPAATPLAEAGGSNAPGPVPIAPAPAREKGASKPVVGAQQPLPTDEVGLQIPKASIKRIMKLDPDTKALSQVGGWYGVLSAAAVPWHVSPVTGSHSHSLGGVGGFSCCARSGHNTHPPTHPHTHRTPSCWWARRRSCWWTSSPGPRTRWRWPTAGRPSSKCVHIPSSLLAPCRVVSPLARPSLSRRCGVFFVLNSDWPTTIS